jgi:hypothetical protein
LTATSTWPRSEGPAREPRFDALAEDGIVREADAQQQRGGEIFRW